MIDKSFCTEAFEERGPDTEAAQELADLLAEEIQAELHQAIQPALERVIQKLNQLGHHLTLNQQPIPGEVAYGDENNGNGHKLRVAVDTIVSTGYPHLIYVD